MKRWQGLLLIYAMIGVMLALSWRRWCDPLVDFGREMYVPWQLSQGKVLYRDIAYFNGPISPYFNAIIFRVFGEGILTLAIVNAILLALLLSILHAILLKISDLSLATITCVLLVPLMCISQPMAMANYNFITPYSHEITHGLLLSLASIAALMQLKRGWHWVAGLLAGLTILTKPEIAIACCIAVMATSCVLFRARIIVQMLLAMMMPAIIAWLVFSSSAFIAYQHLFDSRITSLLFYRLTMGTADIVQSLTNIALATAVWGALLLVALTCGKATSARHAGIYVLGGFVLAIALGLIFRSHLWIAATPLIVAMPTILIFAIRRGETDPSRGIARLSLMLFALLLLGKIWLNIVLFRYGFALALPAVACVMIAFAATFPDALASRARSGVPLRGMAMGLLAGFAVIHVVMSCYHWFGKSFEVCAELDRIVVDQRHSPVFGAFSDVQTLPTNATVAVLPQGAMLNYLTRRENSTPYIVLMPPEVIMFGEDGIVASYEARPPEYVLFIQTDLREYGYGSFDEYAPKITSFLRAHYDRVKNEEGYFLLRHK